MSWVKQNTVLDVDTFSYVSSFSISSSNISAGSFYKGVDAVATPPDTVLNLGSSYSLSAKNISN
jgi:hypothetical protein